MNKLAIIVLGKRNSGKSTTWYYLFNKNITKRLKSGYKKLRIDEKSVDVFIVNGSSEERKKEISKMIFVKNSSPEERGEDIGGYLNGKLPPIIFCSVQYTEHGKVTIDWFRKNNYQLYIQWLNPGHKDKKKYEDELEFHKHFKGADFNAVSGKEYTNRTEQIKNFFEDWYKKNSSH